VEEAPVAAFSAAPARVYSKAAASGAAASAWGRDLKIEATDGASEVAQGNGGAPFSSSPA